MKKKEYIERAKQCMLNRIKFHAPLVYDDDIDKRALFVKGVDVNLPIFKFDKKLSNHLLKAFKLAQEEAKFNLVLSHSSIQKVKENKLNKLKNLCIFSENDSASFLKSINKLNINYYASSNYNLRYNENFVCVNGERINPTFNDFALSKIQYFGDVLMHYKEFVLNGNNVYLNFYNNSENETKIDIEINFLLKNGYFFVKKNRKNVIIENILQKEKTYLNYVCEHAQFCFSNVDGLENSCFACVNVKASFCMKAQERKRVFFNFGADKFVFNEGDDFEKLFEKSKTLSHEIFNVKVKTKNPKFDLMFNRTLPQKIWLNWINQTPEVFLEEKYLAYKRMFVKGEENLSLVSLREIGLRELGIFNGKYYKKFVVVVSDRKFFKIGKTIFFELQNISKSMLQSREPVSFSFG